MPSVDAIKTWVPIVVLAAGIVASYTTLQANVAKAQESADNARITTKELDAIQRELRISTALQNQKLESIAEDQADLKRLLENVVRQLQ